jgi:hypothetical protein
MTPSTPLWSLLDMLKIDAGRLLIHVNGLSFAAHNIPAHGRLAMPVANYKSIKDNIEFVCSELARMDLSLPLISAEHLRKVINEESEERSGKEFPESKAMTWTALGTGRFKNYATDLVNRLKDTLSAKVILVLQEREARLYEPREPIFGNVVNSKFPTTGAFEIDEAAKCLALGRATACVFHLMRVIEVGLDAIRLSLGLPQLQQTARNWGSILNQIKQEKEKRDKTTPSGWIDVNDSSLYAEIYISLDAVKNVWRNTTMHVENKYTPEEAEHIFNAVHGLMTKISSRVDEQGMPRA